MSADDKPESSHEFNFFLDRQLQNNLLDIDEQLISTDNYLAHNHGVHCVSNGEGRSTFVKSQTKCEEITGWIQDSKTNFRKPEKEYKPTKEFIQPWKDFKTKAQQDTYVFKHFSDPIYYIEQYRYEHAMVMGLRSQLTRSEFGSGGDLRRYLGHHSSPSPNNNGVSSSCSQNYVPPQSTACNSCNGNNHNGHSKHSSSNSAPSSSQNQLLTASMHYTNKKDSKSLPSNSTSSQSKFNNPSKNSHNHHNSNNNNQNSNHGHQCTKHVHTPSDQGYKYKLAPEAMWRSGSSQSGDHGDGRTPRLHSAKADGRGKMPTKVMVPAGVPNGIVKQHPLQTVTV